MMERLRAAARALRTELRVCRLVLAHERTPRVAKLLIGAALVYGASPIDVIPDWVPMLGQLDDLVIVPALAVLGMRYVPDEVIDECRRAVRA